MNMSDRNVWIWKVTDWSPTGKRKCGRLKKSLRNKLDEVM